VDLAVRGLVVFREMLDLREYKEKMAFRDH
jgi:hypothetical protein